MAIFQDIAGDKAGTRKGFVQNPTLTADPSEVGKQRAGLYRSLKHGGQVLMAKAQAMMLRRGANEKYAEQQAEKDAAERAHHAWTDEQVRRKNFDVKAAQKARDVTVALKKLGHAKIAELKNNPSIDSSVQFKEYWDSLTSQFRLDNQDDLSQLPDEAFDLIDGHVTPTADQALAIEAGFADESITNRDRNRHVNTLYDGLQAWGILQQETALLKTELDAAQKDNRQAIERGFNLLDQDLASADAPHSAFRDNVAHVIGNVNDLYGEGFGLRTKDYLRIVDAIPSLIGAVADAAEEENFGYWDPASGKKNPESDKQHADNLSDAILETVGLLEEMRPLFANDPVAVAAFDKQVLAAKQDLGQKLGNYINKISATYPKEEATLYTDVSQESEASKFVTESWGRSFLRNPYLKEMISEGLGDGVWTKMFGNATTTFSQAGGPKNKAADPTSSRGYADQGTTDAGKDFGTGVGPVPQGNETKDGDPNAMTATQEQAVLDAHPPSGTPTLQERLMEPFQMGEEWNEMMDSAAVDFSRLTPPAEATMEDKAPIGTQLRTDEEVEEIRAAEAKEPKQKQSTLMEGAQGVVHRFRGGTTMAPEVRKLLESRGFATGMKRGSAATGAQKIMPVYSRARWLPVLNALFATDGWEGYRIDWDWGIGIPKKGYQGTKVNHPDFKGGPIHIEDFISQPHVQKALAQALGKFPPPPWRRMWEEGLTIENLKFNEESGDWVIVGSFEDVKKEYSEASRYSYSLTIEEQRKRLLKQMGSKTPPADFSRLTGGRKRIKLTKKEESNFQKFWKKDPNVQAWIKDLTGKKTKSPDSQLDKFDYRKAWKAGDRPMLTEDGHYHWGSQGKDKDHPTYHKQFEK